VSVEEVGAIWGTIGKVGAWEARKGYRAAQNIGMRYQNWRHKGADEEPPIGAEVRLSPHTGTPAGNNLPARKGKNWTTDEESFKNTTYSETTYTRKRTR
jgi:hypothetical protein